MNGRLLHYNVLVNKFRPTKFVKDHYQKLVVCFAMLINRQAAIMNNMTTDASLCL